MPRINRCGSCAWHNKRGMTRHGFVQILSLAPLLVFLVLGILLAGAHSAQAADASVGFVPLADFSGPSKLNDIYKSKDLGTFIGRLFFASISLGAILAVLRLSWARSEER